MKIGFVVSTFPCLSQTFVWDQIQGMLDLGQEVHVFSRNKSIGKFNKNDNLNIHYEPKVDFRNLLIAIMFYLKNPLVFFHLLPCIWGLRGCNALRFLISLYWYKSELLQNIDAFVVHFGPNGLRFQVMKDLGLIHCPLFVFFHGYDISEILKLRGSRYYEKLFKKGTFLLPISRYWAGILSNNGATSESIIVHHMGVDIDNFEFKVRTLSKKTVIVSVSRLVEKKGLKYALEALSFLKKDGIDFVYKIVGSGPLECELKKHILNLGLGNNVYLIGSKNHSEVKEILNEADIFLLPSVTADNGDQEGIPVSIMEAMAVGLPVVSTYHSGIPELVKNGFNGILVPERNSCAIFDGIKNIIENNDKFRELSINARKTIEENFNLDLLNKKLLSYIYGEVNVK